MEIEFMMMLMEIEFMMHLFLMKTDLVMLFSSKSFIRN